MSQENENQDPSIEKPQAVEPSSILDSLEEKIAAQQEPASSESTENIQEGALRRNSPQTTEIKLDPFSEGENKHRQELLITPPVKTKEIEKRLESINREEVSAHKNAALWTTVLARSIQTSSFQGDGDEVLERPGTNWTQQIKFGNFGIGPSASRVSFEEGTVLTGVQALAATQRHLGLGGNFTTVLPHSGFWITLKPPTEETIIELNRQYNQIKTELGRATYGLLLGSHSALVNELVVRFALSSMVRNSIKDVDDILKMTSVHDIDIIIWAYVCTMYPNGFNHKTACIADPSKCLHVVEDLINVRRLFFMDKNAFSQEQLQHLTSNTQASMSVESVLKFRESMKDRERRVIKIAEDTEEETHFVLRVPSAFEYFESSNRWINSIGTKVIEALGADSSYNERNKLIDEHSAVTQMRKYSHWVEEIRVGGGIINGREDIENNLDLMSTSISIRKEFDEKVGKYIRDTRIALIGIPDFKCPSCNQYQITEEHTDPLNRSIVALDVLNTFFTILVQRVQLLLDYQG